MSTPTVISSFSRGSRIAIWSFLAFTLVALVGYGTFGRHPQLLASFPGLAAFYGTAFKFFAQAHVVIAAVALAYYLVRKVRFAWIPGLVAVYAASLISELAGTSTGIPFGAYSYSGLLGWKWFDLVPALIPLSWYLMALPSFVIARRRFPSNLPLRLLLGAALLTAWDLALDPAMSGVTNYWTWGEPGPYYGMPLINLAGWMLTGVVLMMLLYATARPAWLDRLSLDWMTAYYAVTLLMPLGMIALSGMWPALIVGLVVPGALLVYAMRGRRGGGGPTEYKDTIKSTDTSVDERPVVADRGEALAFVRARADEAGDTAVPLTFFSKHSRSFSFAARWFGDEERRLVAGLYAFCRTTDDLVDRAYAPREEVEARLDAWRQLADRAYAEGDTGVEWLDAVMSASAERGVPIRLAHELIDGVRMDLEHVRIATWEELDLYMYRVASVVGIWMCYLFGVTDPAVHRRAAALGKAMQLTNILRDVGDDLGDDRIYLPREALERYDISEARLREVRASLAEGQDVPPAYRALMHEMIGRADALYELARPGFASLPAAFARASAIAAGIYRGIHEEIRANEYDNLRQRAVTSLPRKVLLAARAVAGQPLRNLHPSSGPVRRTKVVGKAAAGTAAALIVAAGLSGASAAPMADCPDLSDLRGTYIAAVDDGERIDPAREALVGCDKAIYRAYDAALVTLLGKHAFWPPAKYKHVRQGLAALDDAVTQAPADVEIRYLRLLSAYFLPEFFGRQWSVADDFDVLAALLPAARGEFPRSLYADMIRFVLHRGEPSAERRDALVAALRSTRLPSES